MGGVGKNKKMRFIAAVLLGLAGGMTSAMAQTASPPAAPATAQPIAKPATAAMATPAVQLVSAPVLAPAEKPAANPAGQPVTQSVSVALAPANPSAQPDAKPLKQTVAVPVAPAALKPAEAPAPARVAVAEPSCPGHPDALGTSRVLTITSGEFQELGRINYKQTLPLEDHEVVLTFDDGPIPPFTNSVLATLAANCVKATYFLVGEMAHYHPYLVREIYNQGHSIGTHSQDHPFAFQRLSMQRVAYEVNAGIASVDAAVGDPRAISPFFRIPGFGRTKAIDHFLEQKGLITWSADIDTDDWKRGTTPGELIKRTMRRLNARGRGIILMHDIHPDTALALPALLKALKAAGYHVVHVVAAGQRPQSVPEVTARAIEQESWPQVLHAQADKGGATMSALRHRVKLAIARNVHHRTAVRGKEPAKIDFAGIAMEQRLANTVENH
jgi:peptidoglycan/xylan/chitin deacetylase (PgdA/CDA1 family)